MFLSLKVFSQTPSEGALCAKWAHRVANLTISVNHCTPPVTLNISLQLYSMDGTQNFPSFPHTWEQF